MNVKIVFPTELRLNFMSLQQQEAVFSKKKKKKKKKKNPNKPRETPPVIMRSENFFQGVGEEMNLKIFSPTKIRLNLMPQKKQDFFFRKKKKKKKKAHMNLQ